MSLHRHNIDQLPILEAVRADIAEKLGEELGTDPTATSQGRLEIELRLAHWLTTPNESGVTGGQWLANQPHVHAVRD